MCHLWRYVQKVEKLKVTGHSKTEFFCWVSPISTRLFWYITYVSLNARVSSNLDLIHNLSPFGIFSIDFADF